MSDALFDDVWARIDDIDEMREMARNCVRVSNDEILRLRDTLEAIKNLGSIPAEDVARHFIDNEMGNPFSPMYRHAAQPHEVNGMLARLTEVIRRARVDGANTNA